MVDYQSENDSIHLNHAKPYSAIIPEGNIVLIPKSQSSHSLWGKAMFSSWPLDEISANFGLDQGVYAVVQ